MSQTHLGNTDRFAPLIPWYANGTLKEGERRRVEGHLPGCASCRDLLAHARAGLSATADVGPARLAEHVQSQLLVEFVERPRDLDSETAEWIRAHLRACVICREASEVLAAAAAHLEREGAGGIRLSIVDRLRGVAAAVWRTMAGSVLRPVPALLYLVALLLAYPSVRVLSQRSGWAAPPAATSLPPAMVLFPDASFRGEPSTPSAGPLAGAAPIELPAPRAPGELLLLELHTEIDEAETSDPSASFLLRLADGGRILWSERKRGNDFDRGGLLRIVLRAESLPAGRPLSIVVLLEKPGDPLDGRMLFERTIRVRAGGGSGAP